MPGTPGIGTLGIGTYSPLQDCPHYFTKCNVGTLVPYRRSFIKFKLLIKSGYSTYVVYMKHKQLRYIIINPKKYCTVYISAKA